MTNSPSPDSAEPNPEPTADRSKRKLVFLGRPDFSSMEALREFVKRAAEAIRQQTEQHAAEKSAESTEQQGKL